MHKPLTAGSYVSYEGKLWRVETVLNARKVCIMNEGTHERRTADAQDVTAQPVGGALPPIDALDSKAWQVAAYRLECIQPLLNQRCLTRGTVKRRAQEFGADTATVYRWKREYEKSLQLSALLPRRRERKPRLSPEVDQLISEVTESLYLTMRRPTATAVAKEVQRRCALNGIDSPHPNTVRNRLKAVNPGLAARKRVGRNEGQKFEQLRGTFPGAHAPLAVVEIDHCLLNVIVTDPARRPIGRPWLTAAIDVFSRMIIGYYLTLDPPGSASTAMCIVNSIMPKREFLRSLELKSGWPCWGKMDAILVDNAKEFRSGTFVRACQEHGISIQYRPAKRPHFAGHIERFFGTIQRDLEALPGSTFSSPKKKGDSNPVKTAAVTMTELEHWLAIRIVDVYHNEVHSSITTPPLRRYEQGLFDDTHGLPRGLPAPISKTDSEKLRLDFMPSFSRTVQPYGVVINHMRYNHEALAAFVHASGRTLKSKARFIFKQDPSNLQHVYFLDPKLNTYVGIPCRDLAMPPITLWQWREALKRTKKEGADASNPELVFNSLARMLGIEKSAVQARNAARRRSRQPKRLASRTVTAINSPQTTESATSIPSDMAGLTDEMIQPFDDLE